MRGRIQIEDPNFFRRLVNLRIVPPHPDRIVPISALRKVRELRLHNARIRSVKELPYFDRLQTVDLSRNRLENIDLSGNPELRSVKLANAHLKSLQLGPSKKLAYLDLRGNRLETLHLPEDNGLFELNVSHNRLPELDLSGCRDLGVLEVDNNRLRELVPPSRRLVYLQCAQNRMTRLDLGAHRTLEYLNATGNRIETCVLPMNGALRFALLANNPIDGEEWQRSYQHPGLAFTDTKRLMYERNSFYGYRSSYFKELGEQDMKRYRENKHPAFCAMMLHTELYDALKRYDWKQRLHRYRRGLVFLSLEVMIHLNYARASGSSTYTTNNFLVDKEKTLFQEDRSTLDLQGFPDSLALSLNGRVVVFYAEEVALTSDGGIPLEVAHVRYLEHALDRVKQLRSVIVWNT